MSFTFDWPNFSDQFHYDAIQMLNTALNKGSKPPVMADKIEVIELYMGEQPPELEIRDIGELTTDQFRGIFRFTYSGDAHIVLKTKVQANPLNHKQPDIHLMTGSRGMLAAKQPLVVPMLLRLSHFRLNSYVVLVVSKQKGITLVFKTDPLQNVDINSTFDSIAVIQKFIQREIEGQLRQMFREDLPGIIHRLSQQWIKAKVEAPYLLRHPPFRRPALATVSEPDLSSNHPSHLSIDIKPRPFVLTPKKTRSLSGASVTSTGGRSNLNDSDRPSKSTTAESVTSFPDLENYDPTYGLRPEGLPTKSAFGDFSRLFTPNRGLADLTEENSDHEEDDCEAESFDVIDWDNSIPDGVSVSPSPLDDVDDVIGFEKIPAVGGGTITRPRVYHSQSMVQAPSGISGSRPPFLERQSDERISLGIRSVPLQHQHAHSTSSYPSSSSNYQHLSVTRYHLSGLTDRIVRPSRTRSESALDPASSHSFSARPVSTETRHSQSSNDTPPISVSSSGIRHSGDSPIYTTFTSQRRSSISSDTFLSSSPTHYDGQESDPKIILRPSHNNTIHQLSTLSHSNHTLSPYTRSFTHFTVRSFPPRAPGTQGLSLPPDRPPVKATRKRIYHISLKPKPKPDAVQEPAVEVTSVPLSPPVPPSEFDASDLDRYFRSQDYKPPNIHLSHVC